MVNRYQPSGKVSVVICISKIVKIFTYLTLTKEVLALTLNSFGILSHMLKWYIVYGSQESKLYYVSVQDLKIFTLDLNSIGLEKTVLVFWVICWNDLLFMVVKLKKSKSVGVKVLGVRSVFLCYPFFSKYLTKLSPQSYTRYNMMLIIILHSKCQMFWMKGWDKVKLLIPIT